MSFLYRYQEYASRMTNAPPVYHQALSYALVGAAVRRRVWLDYAGGRLYPNVWLCLLGDSGVTRKSTSLNIAAGILRRLPDDPQYPNDFSLQRLYEIMAAKPQGTLVYREFRHLADMLQRDYMAGTKAVLTDVYDCPPKIEYETKGGGLVQVKEPCLSILAASTVAWFGARDTQRDIEGGFLARFTFIPAGLDDCLPSLALPDGEDTTSSARTQLGAELANIALSGGRMSLSGGARKAYEQWFAWHEAHSPLRETGFPAWMPRYQALCLKLAMVHHLASGSDAYAPLASSSITVVTEDVAEWEKRLAACLKSEAAFSSFQTVRKRALKLIPNGGGEIPQRDLMRGLRVPLKEFQAVIQTLVAEGMVASRAQRVHGEQKVFWKKIEDAAR